MKTRTYFAEGDRYEFDFGPCSIREGYAQLDTRQDASYYGNWANPTTLVIFSFVEGDCTLTQCDNSEEFAAEIRKMAKWHIDNGYGFGIDPGLSDDRDAAWNAIGLGEFLPNAANGHRYNYCPRG